MLTDADIKKLKQAFATKDDLKAFATKDDLADMEKRQDAKCATKADLKSLHESIIKDMSNVLEDSLLPILNEHEKRLDRLEKHVGGFPSI